MTKGLVLAVTPSVKLRKSQATLYEFVVKKHASNDVINLTEIVDLYSKHGCRETINGKPARYIYDYKNEKYNIRLLSQDELRVWALRWFVRNLGVFVIKGLLTAIPTMDLKQLEIEND